MKNLVFTLSLLTLFSTGLFAANDGDHEYAPIKEKEIEYKNFVYDNTMSDGKTSLREFAKGKKLVHVFYYAHWCHSTNYQAPITERMYRKYKDKGYGLIGVNMYGSLSETQNKIRWWKFSFPSVTETLSMKKRTSSQHFKYRVKTGDNRKWATPWNIFLDPSKFSDEGEVLVKKAFVANGELREREYENFIRKSLGMKPLPEEKKDKKKG